MDRTVRRRIGREGGIRGGPGARRADLPRGRRADSPIAEYGNGPLGFKVRDVESILTEWRALGYEVDRKFEGGGGSPGAYITMPDGVTLELQEDSALSVKAEMDHVHFVAPQPRELSAWYTDLFGAMPRSGSDVGMTADVPGSALIFNDSEEKRAPTEGTVIDHIGFEVEDMDAFVETLKARDVEFVMEPRYIKSLELWITFFTDPSGVLVEVSEGLDNY